MFGSCANEIWEPIKPKHKTHARAVDNDNDNNNPSGSMIHLNTAVAEEVSYLLLASNSEGKGKETYMGHHAATRLMNTNTMITHGVFPYVAPDTLHGGGGDESSSSPIIHHHLLPP